MSDLPEPGSPIVLADGTKIDPHTGARKKEFVAVPSNTEAQRLVTETRKRLDDLPDIPSKMNVVAAVAAYTLFGLSAEEIALALGTNADQVKRIQGTGSFSTFTDEVMEAVSSRHADEVRGLLHVASKNAAERVTELMQSEDEKVALAAAQDVLNRDGHRPADVVEHRHSMQGGLVIKYVDATDDNASTGLTIEHEGDL